MNSKNKNDQQISTVSQEQWKRTAQNENEQIFQLIWK